MLPGPPRELPKPGSANSRQFLRHLAAATAADSSLSPAFLGYIPAHAPNRERPPTPPQLSAVRVPFLPSSRPPALKRKSWGGVGEAAGGEGGHARKNLPGRPGWKHPKRNESFCRPWRFARRRPSPRHLWQHHYCLPPSSLLFALCKIRNLVQRKETEAKRFGGLPAILLSHGATQGSGCV